jgi:hypothetical protein
VSLNNTYLKTRNFSSKRAVMAVSLSALKYSGFVSFQRILEKECTSNVFERPAWQLGIWPAYSLAYLMSVGEIWRARHRFRRLRKLQAVVIEKWRKHGCCWRSIAKCTCSVSIVVIERRSLKRILRGFMFNRYISRLFNGLLEHDLVRGVESWQIGIDF